MTIVSRESDVACIEREPAAVASAWSALSADRRPPSIFLTPEWIAVARAHQSSTPITLSIGEPVRGIAALTREADVSHAWEIREAIAQGDTTYDVLPDDEPYKYDHGARDRWLARLDPERV